jgi:hypothetical protein
MAGRTNYSPVARFDRYNWRSGRAVDPVLLRWGPVLFTFAVYVVFMFRDPDRLQSEEYRVRQQALRYLYKKGGSTEIVDIANQVARIETSKSRLDGGEKE